jgi:hypothetical protein
MAGCFFPRHLLNILLPYSREIFALHHFDPGTGTPQGFVPSVRPTKLDLVGVALARVIREMIPVVS